jgi:hypothetical protein
LNAFQTKILWLGLLASNGFLMGQFILAMEAALVLLANFVTPIKTLVSHKLHEWKCV